ncbi:hypothetical protein BDV95DRAFT_607103 [Massariosphaeria phaeospora]|uniref:Cell wall mannoprotein PIR1-like C-terminal domain-containing protein n=1 Tax=Massariosphaeria phaeospora TaxID=100035 RepID=A0A7C8MP47_9PLEO|nr:hypothetical protein BDV95DRAFT_607103 [Massariosphaeria phaeospora]
MMRASFMIQTVLASATAMIMPPPSLSILPRDTSCAFTLTGHGPSSANGTIGQLSDGQNRIGGGRPIGKYTLQDGGVIVDKNGRGCILTPPTTQFQCDDGASPTPGFDISCGNELTYNGSSVFHACPVNDYGEWNVYVLPAPNQKKCVEITLTANGNCAPNCMGHGPVQPSATAHASWSTVIVPPAHTSSSAAIVPPSAHASTSAAIVPPPAHASTSAAIVPPPAHASTSAATVSPPAHASSSAATVSPPAHTSSSAGTVLSPAHASSSAATVLPPAHANSSAATVSHPAHTSSSAATVSLPAHTLSSVVTVTVWVSVSITTVTVPLPAHASPSVATICSNHGKGNGSCPHVTVTATHTAYLCNGKCSSAKGNGTHPTTLLPVPSPSMTRCDSEDGDDCKSAPTAYPTDLWCFRDVEDGR